MQDRFTYLNEETNSLGNALDWMLTDERGPGKHIVLLVILKTGDTISL